VRLARLAFVALVAALTGCGGKTEDAAVGADPCASCVDAGVDTSLTDASGADATAIETTVMDSLTLDTRDASPPTSDADADACRLYSQTATCCEGSSSFGPEITLCPGVTCRNLIFCDHGFLREDHDSCFFKRHECIDAAVPPDTLDAGEEIDTAETD
jgi:hypothetical protein